MNTPPRGATRIRGAILVHRGYRDTRRVLCQARLRHFERLRPVAAAQPSRRAPQGRERVRAQSHDRWHSSIRYVVRSRLWCEQSHCHDSSSCSSAHAHACIVGPGYHVDNTTGIATGNEEESIYAVMSGTHINGGCCFVSLLSPAYAPCPDQCARALL